MAKKYDRVNDLCNEFGLLRSSVLYILQEALSEEDILRRCSLARDKKNNPNMSRAERSQINIGDRFGHIEILEELPKETVVYGKNRTVRHQRKFRFLCHACGKEGTTFKERLLSKQQPFTRCGCGRGRQGLYGHLYQQGEEKQVPKSTIRVLARLYGEEATTEFIDNYGGGISSLELQVSKLLGLPCMKEALFFSNGKYRRPDFKISDSLYVDVDGLWFHTVLKKGSGYHVKKRRDYEQDGKRLLQFHADEIGGKPEIVKSIIQNALGNTPEKIGARKCVIKKVPDEQSASFQAANHLMTPRVVGTIAYGLYYEEALVSIMVIRRKEKTIDITRFCNKINTSVQGGFSKLLKHVIVELSPDIITNYVDLRYGTGAHLNKYGFIKESEHIGIFYTDGRKKVPRQAVWKKGDTRTQAQIAEDMGLLKVEDAGQAKFVLHLN